MTQPYWLYRRVLMEKPLINRTHTYNGNGAPSQSQSQCVMRSSPGGNYERTVIFCKITLTAILLICCSE